MCEGGRGRGRGCFKGSLGGDFRSEGSRINEPS